MLFRSKQTTNLTRAQFDSILYKVDVNTMDQLTLGNGKLTKETLGFQLNQIGKVVLSTAKEMYFDSYKMNKSCGSFILIDPITNNTSAVGMIISKVADNDLHNEADIPTLNLLKMDLSTKEHEAVIKVGNELANQGVIIRLIE